MKKDIEWLKEKVQKRIDKLPRTYSGLYIDGSRDAYHLALKDIDQLDEPEVLSQEFINEKAVEVYADTADAEVHAVFRIRDLQNLLVPKQEEVDQAYKDGYEKGKQCTFYKGYLEGLAEGERKTNEYFESIAEEPSYEQVQKYLSEHGMEVVELPVIPKFVAEWIEELKQDERPLYSVMSSLMNKTNHEWAVWKSANKNFSEIVAQAWLDGYEVAEEREQKYRVIFPSVDKNGKGFNYLAKDCYHKELWVEDARSDGLAWEERSLFTEDEIRDLDKGDILFEHFAVKVEELEEDV